MDKRIRIIIIIIIPLVLLPYFVCFRSNDMEGPKWGGGPFTGKVVDAETGEPIAGAQVRVEASFITFIFGSDEVGFFGQTNKKGRYLLPPILHFGLGTISSFKLVVYKAGYVAYSSKWDFYDKKWIKDFRVRGNRVYLKKWDDKKFTEKDRVKHVDFIGCSYHVMGRRRVMKFCREAREEMILGCLAHDRDRTRDLCIEIIDDKLK